MLKEINDSFFEMPALDISKEKRMGIIEQDPEELTHQLYLSK